MSFGRFHYVIIQAITVLVAVVAACAAPRPRAKPAPSATPKPTPKVTASPAGTTLRPEARVIAERERASFVTEVSFTTNSYALTPETKRRLTQALAKANHTGADIERIHLIVWADHEYPSAQRKHLPSEQVRLADRRAKSINDFLKERTPKAISEAYNMAERPGTLQTLLATADARIKRTLEGAGIPTTANDVGSPEYAAKALVLFLASPARDE